MGSFVSTLCGDPDDVPPTVNPSQPSPAPAQQVPERKRTDAGGAAGAAQWNGVSEVGGVSRNSGGSGNLTSYDTSYSAAALDPMNMMAHGPTQALKAMQDSVISEQTAENFEKKRKLGQGGFGVVWLCERKSAFAPQDSGRWVPKRFALKELISTNCFEPGKSKDIRQFLPLNEAAIQRYMKHEHVVETYWADVRCLDPKSLKPLSIGAKDLVTGTWTSLEDLGDVERTCTEAAQMGPASMYPQVKLQMRIAMEHCDLGSLKDYLVDPNQMNPRHLSDTICARKGKAVHPAMCALLTALDIAEALKFMHKSKTLHGDLKPHNILLKSDPKATETGFSAKISDFGLSAHMTAGQNSVSISVGTEAYLPPEVFRTMAVTEASDIYAMGLLIWEIWYGIFWWSIYDREKRKRGLQSARGMADFGPRCCTKCPRDFAAIVHDCLQKDASKRPTAKDIVDRLINVIADQQAAQGDQAY